MNPQTPPKDHTIHMKISTRETILHTLHNGQMASTSVFARFRLGLTFRLSNTFSWIGLKFGVCFGAISDFGSVMVQPVEHSGWRRWEGTGSEFQVS